MKPFVRLQAGTQMSLSLSDGDGHGHGHDQKTEKNDFWRKLRHKGDYCCFGWAVYAPWACYMHYGRSMPLN